ncbi:nuclear transport factor 2 family protein [Niveispirillum fermenti]|uniref:nuclear transport factor 2 family protein n=1 Tax=Niveispirillum fermenti TaxID=1233113 RepID=UPI003A84D0B6
MTHGDAGLALARDAIGGLLTEFAWRVDNGAGSSVAALFTPDATVETPHFTLQGRAEIDRWFTQRSARGDRLSRHYWSNLRLTPDGDGYLAEANVMTAVGVPPAPQKGATLVLGHSTDKVMLTADGWRFCSRRLTVTFEGTLTDGGHAP